MIPEGTAILVCGLGSLGQACLNRLLEFDDPLVCIDQQPPNGNQLSFYMRNISTFVTTSNYIQLPDAATYRLLNSRKYRHILGTSFGGNLPVGLTIGQAIDRSFDQHKTEYHR